MNIIIFSVIMIVYMSYLFINIITTVTFITIGLLPSFVIDISILLIIILSIFILIPVLSSVSLSMIFSSFSIWTLFLISLLLLNSLGDDFLRDYDCFVIVNVIEIVVAFVFMAVVVVVNDSTHKLQVCF